MNFQCLSVQRECGKRMEVDVWHVHDKIISQHKSLH